jgi:acetolactate synthase-1/2/3 large subunit
LKVAEAVIERLAREVDTCFLVYGGAIATMVEALPGRMKYVCPMHEQSASFMAEGFSKVKGFGFAMSTSGPGGHNMVTGIANCYYDSVPCFFLTGQVSTKLMRPDDSVRQVGFQETPIADICRPITKWSKTILDPAQALPMLDLAIHMAKSGRPGPVLYDLPVDIQKCSV